LSCRKEGHERSIARNVQWSAESHANMPCDIEFPHDFAQSMLRQPCAGRGPNPPR
jgi:hypothetical protein